MNAHIRDAAVVAFISVSVAYLIKLNNSSVPGLRPGVTEVAVDRQAMGSASSKVGSKMSGASGSDVEGLIDNLIANHPVVIFSKSYCPYCRMAKDAVAEAGKMVPGFVEAEVLELDHRQDGAAIQGAIAARTGRTTVPSVYIGGTAIGGGQETTALDRQGKLTDLIRSAVANAAPKPAPAASAAADFDAYVSDLVASNDVVIFSKTYCPYCRAAKAAIAESGAKVQGFSGATIVELDEHENGEAIQQALALKTGRRTVPNVFVGGVNVGGGDDTAQLHNEGVLAQMIRSAPDRRVAMAAEEGGVAGVTKSEPTNEGEALFTFGAGCFWGLELAFQRLHGVVRTEVGYSNGRFSPVSYDAVCSGQSGHAEVVRVWYKPAEVKLVELIELWENRHDVTSLNKQGNDRGTQYRSALLWSDDAGKEAATEWHATRVADGVKVVTQVAGEEGYSPAEGYHQKYLERGGQEAAKGATSTIRCYG
jgi:peptide-methionine (S)-S-oxide reductase